MPGFCCSKLSVPDSLMDVYANFGLLGYIMLLIEVKQDNLKSIRIRLIGYKDMHTSYKYMHGIVFYWFRKEGSHDNLCLGRLHGFFGKLKASSTM
ncbi:unnamed protein product [Sphenostylis stenocarpa]|uniref:Uncharacterized protein n=1 Tax=Sphenostylis stenocarpa TaxID=92480 RepID=A0AA86SIK5_9FABA|nr:unnamed protein product [Sphenostylis stenocarpa]